MPGDAAVVSIVIDLSPLKFRLGALRSCRNERRTFSSRKADMRYTFILAIGTSLMVMGMCPPIGNDLPLSATT